MIILLRKFIYLFFVVIVGLWVILASCGSIRETTEDYTINYSRMTKAEPSRKRASIRQRKTETKKKSDSLKLKSKSKNPIVKSKSKKQKNKSKSVTADYQRRVIKDGSIRQKMIDYSAKFDGTRYKYGGKNPFGFDCSGFTSYVFKKVDIRLPPSANLQSSYGEEISLESVNEGDLLFFETDGTISHVSLVVSHKGDELLIRHASVSSGVIVEDYYQSKYWQKRFSHAIDVLEDK